MEGLDASGCQIRCFLEPVRRLLHELVESASEPSIERSASGHGLLTDATNLIPNRLDASHDFVAFLVRQDRVRELALEHKDLIRQRLNLRRQVAEEVDLCASAGHALLDQLTSQRRRLADALKVRLVRLKFGLLLQGQRLRLLLPATLLDLQVVGLSFLGQLPEQPLLELVDLLDASLQVRTHESTHASARKLLSLLDKVGNPRTDPRDIGIRVLVHQSLEEALGSFVLLLLQRGQPSLFIRQRLVGQLFATDVHSVDELNLQGRDALERRLQLGTAKLGHAELRERTRLVPQCVDEFLDLDNLRIDRLAGKSVEEGLDAGTSGSELVGDHARRFASLARQDIKLRASGSSP